MIPPAILLMVAGAELLRQTRPDIYAQLVDAIRPDRITDFDWHALMLPPFPEMPAPAPDEQTCPDTLTAHLHQLLMVHEGYRLQLYQDTVGKWTIGCGRNLTDRGLRDDEARFLLANDIAETIAQITRALPWFSSLSPVRQAVIADMAFNMGLGNRFRGLLSFKNTLKLIEQGAYDAAASAMLKSKWASQVKTRAVRLAQMMKTDQWPDDIERVTS
jgi:lysozyme